MTPPMTPHTLSLADVAPQAWRNGGGRTRELLAWPDASRWSLRLSVAEVERDGPFSAFPGVERWIAVIEGAGMALHFPGRGEPCRVGARPLRFDGAHAPEARLIDGPTRDLNLMLARGGRGWMQRAEAGVAAPPAASLRAVYVADAATLWHGAASLRLPAHSLAWGAWVAWGAGLEAGHAAWRLDGPSDLRAWWIGHEAGHEVGYGCGHNAGHDIGHESVDESVHETPLERDHDRAHAIDPTARATR